MVELKSRADYPTTRSTAHSDKQRLPIYPYAGWIPTANGRLSFRHIGESRDPTPTKFANVTSGPSRIILCYQKRNLSDSVFRPVVDFVSGTRGVFWFALSAASTAAPDSDLGDIVGRISIFKSKFDWRQGPEESVREAIDSLNELRLSLEGDRAQQIDRLHRTSSAALASSADIVVEFRMLRSGEVYLSSPAFRDENLAYASRDFANQQGHDFDKWIADQSYFFLRDIAHRHQHHSPAVDTILTLQRRSSSFDWRRHIVFSLQYYIISARRTRDLRRLIQSSGVLSYCESFVGIWKSTPWADVEAIPDFQIGALEGSLEAQIREQELKAARAIDRQNQRTNRRVLLVAILAPTLALLGVFLQPHIAGDGKTVEQYPSLNAASDFLSRHWAQALGVVVAVWVILSLWDLVPALLRLTPGKDLLRLAAVGPLRAGAIASLVGALCVGAGAYFGSDALGEIWRSLSEVGAAAMRLIFR